MRIGVIGAGASGMMAAITAAAKPEHEILLFERQARVGRKLLVTGNGRCNLSNWNAAPERYHGAWADFVKPALEQFPVSDTLAFFRGLGLYTVTENGGKVYPYSDQANSVVDVLRFALQRPNLRLLTGCEVTAIRRSKTCFVLETGAETHAVDRVIVACGGAAGGKYGGGLWGYQLLKPLGHHCTRLLPSLVQLKTETAPIKGLKGVRANARLRLVRGDALLAEGRGEVQFTDYGVSGPAVFEISRIAAETDCVLHLDFLPELNADTMLSMLCLRISQHPTMLCGDLLTGMLHNRLGRVLLRNIGVSETLPIHDLKWPPLTVLAASVHDLALPVTGTLGMENAQVTAGGIDVGELCAETMESRIVPGLYVCGELPDIDGDCGGFNLQWAWSSGHLAGSSAAN